MTADGSLSAETVRRWMEEAAAAIAAQRDYLTQLDAAIGDADHGTNMARGFAAVEDRMAALDGVTELGAAQPGDKTMVDALAPAVDAFRSAVAAGRPLTDAASEAERAAEDGMRSTVPMLARKGRASYLGERSIGHQDPGATSAAIIIAALATALAREG